MICLKDTADAGGGAGVWVEVPEQSGSGTLHLGHAVTVCGHFQVSLPHPQKNANVPQAAAGRFNEIQARRPVFPLKMLTNPDCLR